MVYEFVDLQPGCSELAWSGDNLFSKTCIIFITFFKGFLPILITLRTHHTSINTSATIREFI